MGHRVLAQQISKMFGKHMSYLHDKYVVVPNNKANNNIVFACKITLHRQLERNYVLTIYLATPHRKCILYTLLYKQKIKYLSTKICTWEIELWILDFQFFYSYSERSFVNTSFCSIRPSYKHFEYCNLMYHLFV